jgi:hypothetical protein
MHSISINEKQTSCENILDHCDMDYFITIYFIIFLLSHMYVSHSLLFILLFPYQFYNHALDQTALSTFESWEIMMSW